MTSWVVQRAAGPAGSLHGRALEPVRSVTWCEVERPAVVLGSTQRDDVVDTERAVAAGVDVVRRRSGGGAVFLQRDRVVWADVTVPAGDALWDDDVGRASWWLGEVWATALSTVLAPAVAPSMAQSAGVPAGGPVVHRGGLVRTQWSSLVCFAGLGPGEVTLAGAKVVGISQRRTRHVALFQCACLLAWDPAALLDVLQLTDLARHEAAAQLAGVAVGIGAGAGPAVEAAFEAALPSASSETPASLPSV